MMSRFQRLTSLAVLVALCGALAGCGGGGLSNFDPSDLLDFLDSKKKLPGDRKPVFPEGVPGLQPGVPKELYKGAQAEPDVPPQIAPQAPPKGRKAVATSRAPVQVAPADANVLEEGEAAAVPAAPRDAKPKVARRRTTAPPPDSEPAAAPARPAQTAPAQTSASPFPAPLPSGTFSR